MRAVVQRVSRAKVTIEGKVEGEIQKGLLVLIAISNSDNTGTMKWMCSKLVNLRIFPDSEGKMNLSLSDTGGGLLLISNFTLYGNVQRGFRPSFTESAHPTISEPLYLEMVSYLKENYPLQIESGIFGAMMDIELVNDGPVTVIIDK